MLAFHTFAQYGPMGQTTVFDLGRQNERTRQRALLAYKKAKSEGQNLCKWWKDEASLGISMSGPVTYSQRSQYTAIPNINEPSHDTTIMGAAKGLLSLHLNGNSNHLISRLGMNSILSLSVGIQVDMLHYQIQTFDNSTLNVVTQQPLYWQIGVPITLDYKWGCDVDFQPESRTCFAVGAGAMPMLGLSDYNFADLGQCFKVAPLVYASFGVYLMGCWKIRVSYMPGKFTIAKDYKSTVAATTTTLNMQGDHVFTIGIGHMQHSRDWKDGGGWRGSGGRGGRTRYHKHTGGMRRMF
ncbi:hypothetical protein DN068_07745 [Taibaiella soli]|uniref:Uncharacterized protein n=2 Tax=Taibaiella soli TaxID=1649169 RepID=A0A2W2BJI6_9BACT|nr:hypothetical protein DN068_07745 [Taibaiella soli]